MRYDNLIGLFTVKDIIRLQRVNKLSYEIITEFKVVKNLVRFGSLDSSIRLKFWIKYCPFFSV